MKIFSIPEIEVIKKFSGICPYRIKPSSAEQRDPPEPDILCQLEDGSFYAFEVKEVVCEFVARGMSEKILVPSRFRRFLEECPNVLRLAINNKYSNALISIFIGENGQFATIRTSSFLSKFFSYLSNLPNNAIGDFYFESNQCGRVNIDISRGDFNGPLFDILVGGSYYNPIIETAIKALSRDYTTSHQSDLILYYSQQPPPLLHEIEEAIEFFTIRASKSKFRRVWIYSYNDGTILAAYPEI
jgi:hypothetical protein